MRISSWLFRVPAYASALLPKLALGVYDCYMQLKRLHASCGSLARAIVHSSRLVAMCTNRAAWNQQLEDERD